MVVFPDNDLRANSRPYIYDAFFFADCANFSFEITRESSEPVIPNTPASTFTANQAYNLNLNALYVCGVERENVTWTSMT